MAGRPFPAYRGEEPYIFVSYSHADADSVYPDLTWLQEQGINVWYDEGISPGSRWSDALAEALDGASHFVYCITPNSVASQNCLDEVGFALEREKPMLAVHLAPTDLPPGLALRLGSRQAIMKFELAEPAYRAKLAEVLGAYARSEAPVEPPAGLSTLGESIERMCSSMAIVPLECRSNDEDLLALGESIAEDVTDIMAAFWRGQRLIGGREAARFRDSGASGREIADALNVGAVLKGNIRKLGSKVRITVDLVNADGERIWSHRFDEDEQSLFDREDEIVDRIAWGATDGLREYLYARVADVPTDQLGSWGIMYQAWRASNLAVDPASRARVNALIERIIERNPYQPIFKGFLATRLAQDVLQGYSADRERDARRALALAEDAARSGIGIAMIDAGQTFGFLGDHARALSVAQRAYQKAPRVAMIKQNYAARLLYNGRAGEALQVFGEFEAMNLPGQIPPLEFISQAHAILGDVDAALEAARQAVSHGIGDPVIARSAYANALARADRIEEAARQIQALHEILPGYTLRSSIGAYRRAFGTEESRVAVTSGLQTLMDLGYD